MTQAFDSAYRGLTAPAARLYRLAGICPLEETGTALLAALADTDTVTGQACADELVAAGLLTAITTQLYRFDDRQRAHAAACTRREETEIDADAVRSRLFDALLAWATKAEQDITPSHATLAHTHEPAPQTPFAGATAALAWLEDHLATYMAVIRYASAHERYAQCWQVVDALWPLWLRMVHLPERLEAHQIALAAARTAGHDAAEGRMLTCLGGTAQIAGRLREALDYHELAVEHYTRTGDVLGLAQALNGLGKLTMTVGVDLDRAQVLAQDALTLRSQQGYRRGQGLSQQLLGRIAHARGDEPAAREHLLGAYRILLEVGDEYDAAWTLTWAAETLAAQGDTTRALDELDQAHEMMQETGSTPGLAGVLEITGQIQEVAGLPIAARGSFNTAFSLIENRNTVAAARIGARLEALATG